MDRLVETTTGGPPVKSQTNLRARVHPHCVVCSPDHPFGLGLEFAAGADDTVVAEFELDHTVQGYRGWPHGGITSAILDGAMTNWLFAHGLTCVTADLRVRFRHPVMLDEPGKVIARLKGASPPLYVLEAQIMQSGQLRVLATGRFMHNRQGGGRASDHR